MAAAVRASFAGRTVGDGGTVGAAGTWRGVTASPTQLCTRVMPPDAKPTWNEVFFFPLRVRRPLRAPRAGAPINPLFKSPL